MCVNRVGGSEPMRDHNLHDCLVLIRVHSGLCTVYVACVYVHWNFSIITSTKVID